MNEQDSLDEIQVSRIVHFVIPNGECRPGLVLNDWPSSGRPGLANLAVFPDGSNDGKYGIDDHTHRESSSERTGPANLPLMVGWETSVMPNHAVRALRSWHWGRECKKLYPPAPSFVDEEKVIYPHNHVDGMRDPHNCSGCIAEARYIKENIP